MTDMLHINSKFYSDNIFAIVSLQCFILDVKEFTIYQHSHPSPQPHHMSIVVWLTSPVLAIPGTGHITHSSKSS
jgi:hypothetical protein